MKSDNVKLTMYSHGAGCGCKIAPSVLDKVLDGAVSSFVDPNLLVGNSERDDAAVLDMGNGTALISTTDFFMPIVDDAYDFGRIAATNALSDVYAMGGKPILALAILGWPVNRLAPELAQRVMDGAKAVCAEAGITIAGGHSIDSPEPIFGLSVNGIVQKEQLKKNAGVQVGDYLYLTKPLGVGVLSTAQKNGQLLPEDLEKMVVQMTHLNRFGEVISVNEGVTAMTDVTGFGLLGHLIEMCEGSNVTAEIQHDKLPIIDRLDYYFSKNCMPSGTDRNWNSYSHKVVLSNEEHRKVLADPQTSGGLLIAVRPDFTTKFESLAKEHGYDLKSFGSFITREDELSVRVR